MLRALLIDIARAGLNSWRASNSTRRAEERTRDSQRSGTSASLSFAERIPALQSIPIAPDTWDDILVECASIERDNPYIPSGFKWILDYKRYQVELARGNRERAESSLRTAIALAPYNDELLRTYETIYRRNSSVRDIALIVTCKRNEAKALSLAGQLEKAQIEYAIVSGSDRAPIEHRRAIRVLAPDSYEGLPRKVVAAFTWVLENHGTNVGVLKIDDDQTLVDARKLANVVDVLHRLDAYAGVPPEHGPTHDRNWHWNKCQDSALNSRTYGRPYLRPWARGGGYYLGPGPLGRVVLALTRFPGMFEGEYYEDKLVGDILALDNTELRALSGYDDFGLRLADHHRFNTL